MELIGDIVKLVSLPTGGDVPALLKSSVKVVAGGGFGFMSRCAGTSRFLRAPVRFKPSTTDKNQKPRHTSGVF